jgi:hypothetical protein
MLIASLFITVLSLILWRILSLKQQYMYPKLSVDITNLWMDLDERKRELFSLIFLNSLQKWGISLKKLEKKLVPRVISRPTLIKYLKELSSYTVLSPFTIEIDKIPKDRKFFKIRTPKKIKKVYLKLPLILKREKKKGKTFEDVYFVPSYLLPYWEDERIFGLLAILKEKTLTKREVTKFLNYEFPNETQATLEGLLLRKLIYPKIIRKKDSWVVGYSFQSFKRYLLLNFLPPNVNFLNYLVGKLESRKLKTQLTT